jgi:hypothetical protein
MARLLLAVSLLIAVLSVSSSPVRAQSVCTGPFIPVSPALTDLGSGEYTRLDGGPTGVIGGLYPGGSNLRPQAHTAAGAQIAGQVTPLDAAGSPDPASGRVVMLAVGMSNTFMEFRDFARLLSGDPTINPKLTLVNGAQPGRTSPDWVDPNSDTWQVAAQRLANAGVTPQQVQVVWLKNVRTGVGNFPGQPQALQGDLEAIARNLRIHYPNVKLAYLSSRTRSYTYWIGLSPEPAAFESGFAVRWTVEKQINGDPALNFDPANGAVLAPFLSWGPYLWADGSNPRGDGFTWLPADMVGDCTHPSDTGSQRIAQLMRDFFSADATTVPWFLAAPPTAPTVTGIEPDIIWRGRLFPAQVTGSNFANLPAVQIGDQTIGGVIYVSPVALELVTPATLACGSHAVTVTNPDGQSATLANALRVTLTGDFDGDGEVGVSDIHAVAQRWSLTAANPDPDDNPATPNYEARFDIDEDGDIDILDVMAVARNFGLQCQ